MADQETALLYLIATDAEGHEWRVFPEVDLDTMTWSYVVPDGGYRVIAGRAVQAGDKISGRIEISGA